MRKGLSTGDVNITSQRFLQSFGRMFSRIKPFIYLVTCLISVVLVGLSVHDMQTSQGIGLYFALLLGKSDRALFDLLADAAALVALALLVCVPCCLLMAGRKTGQKAELKTERKKKMSRYACTCGRFLVAFLALLPSVDLSALLHLFNTPGTFRLLSGPEDLWESLDQLAPILWLWIPVLCFLYMGFCLSREAVSRSTDCADREIPDGNDSGCMVGNHGKGMMSRILLFLLLIVAALIFPELSFFMAYVAQYLLLILAFSLWEKLRSRYPLLQDLGMILYGGLWLRGIYLMLEVMSIY